MVQDVVNLADKANTVMTSNGDIPYYNSGSRQRLAIGVEGKVLTVSSSDLPAWESASGRLEQLAHGETTNSTTDTVTLSFSEIDLNDYSSLMIEGGGTANAGSSSDLELLIGSVTSNYRYAREKNNTGTWSNTNATGQSEIKLADLASGDWFYFIANISAIEQNEGVDEYAFNWKANAFSTDQWIGGGFTNSGSVDITSLTIQSTEDFAEHCRFNVMGLNRA